jgi:putative membrane protein
LFAVWLAAESPLAQLHEALLTGHMVQHILLALIAGPLLLLSAPALALPRLPSRLRWWPLRAAGRVLNHPLVCWSAAMLVFIGWHVPSIFERAHHSEPWHLAEQASFLGSGLLFWWPVIQPSLTTPRWPRWSMPLYLFFATLPCDALSAFLVFSDRILYPTYVSAAGHHGLSALQDQECAGALMWLCVTLAYGIPAAVITATMLSPTRRPRSPESVHV